MADDTPLLAGSEQNKKGEDNVDLKNMVLFHGKVQRSLHVSLLTDHKYEG